MATEDLDTGEAKGSAPPQAAGGATTSRPERWLQDHGDYLYRYAVRRLRDPSAAEDAVQETLLAALQARDGFGGRSAERTWLTGILKHKIVDAIRRRAREHVVEDIEARLDGAGNPDELFDARGRWLIPPRDWGRPDRLFENERFLAALDACLGRLKPALAAAFTMREVDGRATGDICNDLGITATNCGVMLYRARLQLRECLEQRWGGTGAGVQ